MLSSVSATKKTSLIVYMIKYAENSRIQEVSPARGEILCVLFFVFERTAKNLIASPAAVFEHLNLSIFYFTRYVEVEMINMKCQGEVS